MKKVMLLLIILSIIIAPCAYAHEMLPNGWNIIPAVDANPSASWNNQKKVWALYVNGKEVKRYNTFIGVHRGWGDAPENSLASFKSTKNHGYYGFETDVRFTKDNVAVLCHDNYINNLAVNNDLTPIKGNKIYIKNLTYSQLKNNYIFNIQRLNAEPDKVLSNYNSNRITTFEQMIDFAKSNNMQVSIELKDGTQSQIASIVNIVNQKNARNNVRWISFYVNLLEYVNKADSDEKIGLLIGSAGECNGSNNRYCNGDGTSKADAIYKRLKTNNNMVWFGTSYTARYNLPSTNFGNNMPSTKSTTDQRLRENTLSTIPQAKLTLGTKSVDLSKSNKKEIKYTYDGDGTVKCVSSDTNIAKCSVDQSNKKITITSSSTTSSSTKVNVYATQGIKRSATGDNYITVSIKKDTEPVPPVDDEEDEVVEEQPIEEITPVVEDYTADTIVKNIVIKGYNLNFDKNKHDYKLTIKDEKRLDMFCIFEGTNYYMYKYEILGNENLQNGSTIQVNILENNVRKVRYNIEIVKSTVTPSNPAPTNNNPAPTSETTTSEARTVYVANDNKQPTSESNKPAQENIEKTVVSVPNTDKTDSMLYYVIALSILLFGFVYISNGAKKYQMNKIKR